MGKGKVKVFLKDSVLYGVGDALGRAVGLLMLPILSRIFIPSDYGSLDLLTVAYSFLLLGCTLNVTTGLQKRYYDVQRLELKKLLSSSCFFLITMASGLSFILVWTSSGISEIIQGTKELNIPITILALCLPIEMLLNYLTLLLRLQRKVLLFSAVNIARVIITPLATILFVVIYSFGISGVFMAQLLAVTIITGGLFFRLRKDFSTTITFQPFFDLLKYSLPGHPGILAKQMMNLLPRYLLLTFSTLTAVGLFGVAFRISNSIMMFNNAFNRAWNPFAFANAGASNEKHLYSTIFKLYAFCLLILGTTFALFAKELLTILTPAEYHQAFYYVAGIVYYFAIQGLSIMFSTVLYTQNQVPKVSYLNLMLLVIFLACALFLIPKHGVLGLIVAMDFAITVYFVAYMKITFHYFAFPVPIIRLLFLLAVSVCLTILLSQISLPMTVAIVCKIFALGGLILIGYLLLLSPAERRKPLQYWQQIRGA